jgi:hypothetical protein
MPPEPRSGDVTGPSTAPDPVGPGDEPPLVPVSSARTRRVVLGIAVALLVLVAGGAAVLAMSTGADRDGDDPPAAGAPRTGPGPEASAPAGAQPGDGAPSAGAPPGQEGTPLAVPPDDAFRPVPRLCEEADFSPIFGVLAWAETLGDVEVAEPTFYQRECTFRLEDAGSTGTFGVNISIHSSPDEARGWFDDTLTAETRGERHQELAGDWDANAVLAIPAPDQADVRFMARDETLVLILRTFIVGDAADEAAQQAAVVEIATRLRDGIRA